MIKSYAKTSVARCLLALLGAFSAFTIPVEALPKSPWYRTFTPVWMMDIDIPLIGEPHPIYDDFPDLARPENSDKLFKLALEKPEDEDVQRALIAALSLPEGVPLALRLRKHICTSVAQPKIQFLMSLHRWRPFMRDGGFLPYATSYKLNDAACKTYGLDQYDFVRSVSRDLAYNILLFTHDETRHLSVFNGLVSSIPQLHMIYGLSEELSYEPKSLSHTFDEIESAFEAALLKLRGPKVSAASDGVFAALLYYFHKREHPANAPPLPQHLIQQAIRLSRNSKDIAREKGRYENPYDGLYDYMLKSQGISRAALEEIVPFTKADLRLDPPRADMARRAALAALISVFEYPDFSTNRGVAALALSLLADKSIRDAALKIPTSFQVDIKTIQAVIGKFDPKGDELDQVSRCILAINTKSKSGAEQDFAVCTNAFLPRPVPADGDAPFDLRDPDVVAWMPIHLYYSGKDFGYDGRRR